MKKPIPIEKIGTFLMAASGTTYRTISCQLGMRARTVFYSVKEAPRSIGNEFLQELALQTSEARIAKKMKGFQFIAGLPYCIGLLDGTHVLWPQCTASQYYEYRCYKEWESVVAFEVLTSDRQIIYADVGLPSVIGDKTNLNVEIIEADGSWNLAEIKMAILMD